MPTRRPTTTRKHIEDAAEQLTSLFLLVVVGEFNGGKSAFINALVGAPDHAGGRHPDHLGDQPAPVR